METPWDARLTSVNPITKTVGIAWRWKTLNHWGDPVVPTGFIVERKIGTGDYVIITYDIPPNPNPLDVDYSYDDVLSDGDAAQVLALGYQLVYRVRVYWLATDPDSSTAS